MLLFLKSLLWLNVLVATTFLATAIAGLEFSQNEIAPSILERLEKSTVLASLAYCDSSRIDECSRTKELKGFELVKAFHLHSDHQA